MDKNDYERDLRARRLNPDAPPLPPDWPTLEEGQVAFDALPPIRFDIDGETAIMLVGIIQLAMRHPNMQEDVISETGVRIVEGIRNHFADYPKMQVMIDAGWINIPPESDPYA